MALKGQKTTSDYVEWDKLQSLILKLERDGDTKFALLISIGIYTGLRISDILSLRWNDLIENSVLELTEKKTKKYRRIKINEKLKNIIQRNFTNQNKDEFIFINRFGTSTISVQYINRKLKIIASHYKVSNNINGIKSHSLRKSFGRFVVEKNNYSSKSMILLNEIFNHSSLKNTKVYLGLREEEIFDVYDNL